MAEAMVLDQDMSEKVDAKLVLETAQRETGETLEQSDYDAAVQWIDYFSTDQGYMT
jgi:hypothetical protein